MLKNVLHVMYSWLMNKQFLEIRVAHSSFMLNINNNSNENIRITEKLIKQKQQKNQKKKRIKSFEKQRICKEQHFQRYRNTNVDLDKITFCSDKANQHWKIDESFVTQHTHTHTMYKKKQKPFFILYKAKFYLSV